MNRSDLLAGLPLAATPLAGCTRTSGGLFVPSTVPAGVSLCSAKKWHFAWHDGMSKGGGFSYAYAYLQTRRPAGVPLRRWGRSR